MTQKKRDRRGRDRSAEKQPYPRFLAHKANAAKRGIDWEFTFEEWHQMWIDSGKWAERGNLSHQYVMARHGDQGPYSKDNVTICTALENMKQISKSKHALARLGRGKGWSFNPRSKSKPYFAQIQRRRIGSYATIEEAAAAYRAAVEESMRAVA